ncbi:MAG: hypothetical protein KGJ86_00995 [Chloroflexota bacterium]|nr:hypothetical protein [Chloroflexota bacterium]
MPYAEHWGVADRLTKLQQLGILREWHPMTGGSPRRAFARHRAGGSRQR